VVACVGDSITLGDGASSAQGTYPAALQGLLGPRVVVREFGHSGATLLGGGAGDVPYDAQLEFGEATTFVAQAGPDARVAVVVLLGTNDSKPMNWDAPGRAERFGADFGKLIDHFAALPTHPTVYLATPPGTGDHPCCEIRGDVIAREIIPFIHSVAEARGLPIIDVTSIASHPELLTDGVHPNDEGYELLASKVRDAVANEAPRTQPRQPWWSVFGR
jgi:sialate O-acetylesterase